MWPAVGSEPAVWEPRADAVGPTRAERSAVGRTYQAAIPAEIAGLDPVVAPRVLAQAEEAVAEMRAFDEARGEVGSFAAILLRSESASSSQIEQLTASARAIAEVEVTGADRGNAGVIAANSEAMRAALDLADRLDVDAILRMQKTLLAEAAPHLVGVRWEPVWIGGGGSTPLTADFVPPTYPRVLPALDDLVTFIARDDLPVLVQAAIAHAQFETIHPFADGNGRTGRALVHALLRAKGVTNHITIPVSGGLLQDRDGYLDALDAYRDGSVEPIISAFALSSLRGVQHARTMWSRLDEVKAGWSGRITLRSDSAAWRLLDELVAHPVVDAPLAARLMGVGETNAHRHLAALTEAGVLRAQQHHQSRRTLWHAPEVLVVLDEYAAEVARRVR